MSDPHFAAERRPCDRCGVAAYPSTRVMKVHNLEGNKAVPLQRRVAVWRCPACGFESPREAPVTS
jgi:ribosomal protein L37E